MFTIAHAADGNLHPIIVVDPDLDRLPDGAWEEAGEELGPAAHALQRRIKEVFDPRGILNPGKAL
ncbi:hypothetical protein OG426_05910 [Streptomyces canus]|uniref:FAD-linked oxidase C-terminal domain-containing protein n=1 Tax=Streptomyces canus TaxID=58343 RepID=UPI00386C9402|nr:hypothetical protein OG426_05910 [Streptomyces canus]